jgi:hypothetical protein
LLLLDIMLDVDVVSGTGISSWFSSSFVGEITLCY